MKEHYDVIEAALILIKTLEEGLVQARELLIKRKNKDALFMIHDVVEGIISVDTALEPVFKDLDMLGVMESTSKKMWEGLNDLTNDYENNSGTKALEILDKNLNPAFIKWKKEIQKVLEPRFKIMKKLVETHGKDNEKLF